MAIVTYAFIRRKINSAEAILYLAFVMIVDGLWIISESPIRQIGLMHDIGKIGVPDSVLNKKGRLTDEEYNLMKQHTVIGSDILKNIEDVAGLRDGVRHHHERYDGKGYPDGLKGDEITPFARILCTADSFDAMTSDRVYRGRLTRSRSLTKSRRTAERSLPLRLQTLSLL